MANDTLLITFGCSWTYGVGVNYYPGMSTDDFEKSQWDEEICNKLSWRGIIAKKCNLTNINFSSPGSSNQRQFRLARDFFPSDQFKKLQTQFDRIIVLWGITSTSRNEAYLTKDKEFKNIFYHQETEISKFFLLNFYNHRHEVSELQRGMIFWEDYFSYANIENYWFDTLNTHNYNTVGLARPLHILDADKQSRDLMSWLCNESGMIVHSEYYDWENDIGRVDYLKLKNAINPISMHPTQQSHEKLASYFLKKIKFN